MSTSPDSGNVKGRNTSVDEEATLFGGMGLSASIFAAAIALAVLETFFARRFSPLGDGGRR